ncbi:MAG TPA: adenylyl-sulfate kinase [Chitinophagaceae bacterium]|nr:adenylyl-sulfate kinase [Chitinophagaceae bacterium]
MKSEQGVVLWFTGLPCSGKSTLADELEKYFHKEKMAVQKLDGDLLRATISKDLGFSTADRYRQSERVSYIAKMLSMQGVNVIVALVSPCRNMRAHAKEICSNMKEIYIKCSLEECKKRDVKGMYKKALSGEIENFTGVHDVYEAPLSPDLIVDTEQNTIKQCVSKLIYFLKICCSVYPAISLVG